MLPIDGLRYNIIHQQSGKLVHPEGGSDNPGNDTCLVYYDGPSRLALEWQFKHGQIQQYSSKQFVHPLGGKANNDTPLCLYGGYSGTRTGVAMVIREGLTYLYHAGSNKYVHPKGGSSSPSNDTRLVYYSGYRPGIAVVIASAEDDVKIVDITFDTSQLQSSPSDTISADTVIQNNSNKDQPMEATVSYGRSVSNSFTLQFSEKASFSMSSTTEVSVGLPTIGEAKASMTMTFGVEFGSEQTTAETTMTEVKSSITVKPTVPKNSELKVQVTVQRKHGNVPFTMRLVTSSGVTFSKKGTMKTEYFFEQKIVYN